jgi:hypothetical protein
MGYFIPFKWRYIPQYTTARTDLKGMTADRRLMTAEKTTFSSRRSKKTPAVYQRVQANLNQRITAL